MFLPLKLRAAPVCRAFTFVPAVLLVGCSAASTTDASTASIPAALIVVQGDAQIGQAGVALPTSIVLRAVDQAGVGMHGQMITLFVAEGGGSVTPASDTTNSHGEFSAKWTLGPNATSQKLLASVGAATPVTLSATGLLPAQIVPVQGNNQSAKAGSALTNSVVVRVVGPGNVPMIGVTVEFQVLTGGGAMSPVTVITNALGEASTKWTMGAAGSNTALVSSGALPTVGFTATATP